MENNFTQRQNTQRPQSTNVCALQNALFRSFHSLSRRWSGGAMVLGKLPVPGRPTIWMIVGQGPIVLAAGAGGGC